MARSQHKTVKQLLTDLGDDDELLYWIAYDQLEPLPDPWLQTGILASTIANCHRTKGKAFKPQDFMPIAGNKKAQSEEEMKSVMLGLMQTQEKKEIKGEKL